MKRFFPTCTNRLIFLSVIILYSCVYFALSQVVSPQDYKTVDTSSIDYSRDCANGICQIKYPPPKRRSTCQDLRDSCSQWASQGHCQTNARYMHPHCPQSCRVCHNQTRISSLPFGHTLQLQSPAHYRVYDVAGERYGVPQTVNSQAVLDLLQHIHQYYESVVAANYPSIAQCRNRHALCATWAIQGECEKNPRYMQQECPVVCEACHVFHVETHCPYDPSLPNAWYPGDLNRMFQRIHTDFPQYQPKVYSSPDHNGPWLIVLEQFITPTEAATLIKWGEYVGYHRSTDVGEVRPDGTVTAEVVSTRTSTNAWCQQECQQDPITQGILQRLHNLTQIPLHNAEDLQLLRYEVGQFYGSHHDYIDHEQGQIQGPRILTVFLYLNDVVQGGETHFERLNLTVSPKLGRVVVWPSVYDKNPHRKDMRTMHEALPVLDGIKYGANAWFHLRDYQTPQANGCWE